MLKFSLEDPFFLGLSPSVVKPGSITLFKMVFAGRAKDGKISGRIVFPENDVVDIIASALEFKKETVLVLRTGKDVRDVYQSVKMLRYVAAWSGKQSLQVLVGGDCGIEFGSNGTVVGGSKILMFEVSREGYKKFASRHIAADDLKSIAPKCIELLEGGNGVGCYATRDIHFTPEMIEEWGRIALLS